MKAESAPLSTRSSRAAFHAYRRNGPSPSPSACSSASSSGIGASSSATSASYASASTAASSAARSRAAALASRKRCHSGEVKLAGVDAASASISNAAASTSSLAPNGAIRQRSRKLQRSDSLPAVVTLALHGNGNGKEKAAAVEAREFNTLLEPEYQDEVLQYMTEMESQTGVAIELIDQQPELEWYMRPYLIDFLVEIHSQYRLRPETLYLAVNIADRYTSKRIVYKRHYQLVGCAALWIAAKFEDAKDRVPTVQDLCAMTCNAYDASAFIQMEGHVLSTLNWLIGHPTAEAWLRVAAIADPSLISAESKTQHIARFLMELTLFHRAFVPLRSSEISKGCLLLARYVTGCPRRAGDETELALQIAQMLDGHLADHLEQLSTIVIRKYAQPCFAGVSSLVREWYLAGNRFLPCNWPSSLVFVSASSSASATPPASLTPASYALRRGSSYSSVMSVSSPSSSYFNGNSSDDEDAPLTPSTPLTQYGSDETDPMSAMSAIGPASVPMMACRKASPLSRQVLHSQALEAMIKKEKEITPPAPAGQATGLQVKLVPTSGPSMTLC